MHLNLGYRWCCRLGLEDIVPDHKHKKVRYKPGQAALSNLYMVRGKLRLQ